jgi:hypothetical protein
MHCLEKVIGIQSNCEDEDAPLSGQYITDYPGISLQSASNIADEKTKNGRAFLTDLRRRAANRLQNDVLAFINREYRASSIINNSYQSGEFRQPFTTIAAGNSAQRRGVVIASQKPNCRFLKIVINRIRIFSNTTGTFQLKVSDVYAGTVYTPSVELTAGTIQEFEINKQMRGSEIQITLPSNVSTYSIKPGCKCAGRPNNLVFNGLSNGVTNTTESYGIEVDVSVKCDLSSIVCDLANDGLIGQVLFELCGAMFYDEMTKTSRMNYLTIYNKEEIKTQASAGFAAYSGYMNDLMAGMKKYLISSDGNCGCVECSGIQINSNI